MPALYGIRSPLNHLKKEITWNWSPECKAAFAKIKASLSLDLLTHFNPSLDIVVVSNTFDYGVGAVISHIFPDGSQKAIAHATRSLTTAERNYGQIEKKALAIIYAIKKFVMVIISLFPRLHYPGMSGRITDYSIVPLKFYIFSVTSYILMIAIKAHITSQV